MSNLKNQLIKLGNNNPDLQKHLKPVLDHLDKSSSNKSHKELVREFEDSIQKTKEIGRLFKDDIRKLEYMLEEFKAERFSNFMGASPDTIVREEIPVDVWDYARQRV